MDSNTLTRKRNRKGIGSHYHSRVDVLLRSVLAGVGGYVLASLFTISFSYWWSGSTAANVMAATQYSFLVMVAVVIWAFCAPQFSKAWILTVQVALVLMAIGGAGYVI
ncbi:hypothetical protein L4C38_15730 [Vibrio kasasachensis]|uniref:hypothetical protein n=1 Tax=Vibrio kasasachensis TaxID=2910248 RepID=UPI003D0B071F